MLVFVIPALYPNKDSTRLGSYVFEQIEALHKRSPHDFVVLNAVQRDISSWKYCNRYMRSTDKVGDVYTKLTMGFMSSKFPEINQKLYMHNLFQLFDKAVKEHGFPDRIYAHFSFPSGYCASILSKRYGIPYIVEEHYSLYLQDNVNPYIKKITIETIKGASNFLCVSEKLRDAIYRHTGISSGIKVIPNLVNDKYKFYRKDNHSGLVLFSAGNLYKSKNFDALINAFIQAFDENEDCKLRIAGDGPQRESIEQLIKKTNRSHQIRLLGKLDTDGMLEQYIECDCFGLLSKYETFGIVYREALAVGRPIISYKNGGIEEGWKPEYGYLIENGDFEAVVTALKQLKEKVDKFDSEKISKLCLSEYSGDAISYKILKYIENGK